MSSNDGGLAFPIAIDMGNGTIATHHGMSLRDYLAAKAMQGIVAAGDGYDYEGQRPIDVIPRHAYAMADAMLQERDK